MVTASPGVARAGITRTEMRGLSPLGSSVCAPAGEAAKSSATSAIATTKQTPRPNRAKGAFLSMGSESGARAGEGSA